MFVSSISTEMVKPNCSLNHQNSEKRRRNCTRQGELWPTRPDGDDTGIDLLGDVLTDVAAQNADSERFDLPLLRRLLRFKNVFKGPFQEAKISGRRLRAENSACLSPAVLLTAKRFSDSTPPPKRLRLVGTLDMVRGSTQTFGLQLESGEEVRGVLVEGAIEELAPFINKKILVYGKAVYRASGRLLRIDTDEFRLATDEDEFFARLPKPPRVKLDLKTIFREQQHKKGVKAILGNWPGDETDEQIEQALQEIS